MIRHIVLFRTHENTSREQMQGAIDRLEGLVGVIPGLISLEGGIDIGADGNHDFGLVAELEDQAALDAFSTHDAHMKIAMDILKFRNPEDIVILDIQH
ncbi:Dabb family protein [Clavibacter sp. MX14-G9D]|uniref:Dabb family protein n=1 Tax=Clavibacter sp. MX14-G9D TaxID=3064656 RepID=UPI00293F34AD|nr:Dabb family protein [Clavibacter sp. MX14-G9D]